jgi:hypothetical protein
MDQLFRMDQIFRNAPETLYRAARMRWVVRPGRMRYIADFYVKPLWGFWKSAVGLPLESVWPTKHCSTEEEALHWANTEAHAAVDLYSKQPGDP